MTRRKLIGGSAALATGWALGDAGAQTPVASPVAGHAHAESLVGTDWLAAHQSDVGLLLVALMPEPEFDEAHIGASFRIDWPALEVVDTSDAGVAAWETTVREAIGDLHIEPESRVVVYDNGTLFAARLWWVLTYLGHGDVRVLDGGLPAWRAAGHGVETGPVVTTLEKRPPYPGDSDASVLAQRDEVLAALDDPDTVLVDARTPEEYAEGHIPGAINVNYPQNAGGDPPMWKPADALRELYASVGVTPDRRAIPYCSSGVRSAVTAYTLWLIGYPRVALYTGSWNEWRDLRDAPITTGDHP
jgi:thiosulfate/3-mercaptopyruvate sulfurtransferase